MIFTCAYFDDDEQGVSVWEIPLCTGLVMHDVQFSTPKPALKSLAF